MPSSTPTMRPVNKSVTGLLIHIHTCSLLDYLKSHFFFCSVIDYHSLAHCLFTCFKSLVWLNTFACVDFIPVFLYFGKILSECVTSECACGSFTLQQSQSRKLKANGFVGSCSWRAKYLVVLELFLDDQSSKAEKKRNLRVSGNMGHLRSLDNLHQLTG